MKTIKHTRKCPIYDANFNTDDFDLPLDTGFTFVGLMAMIDPPRPEVAGVIQTCHKAGIKVSMVTGDHPGTAVTIAAMIGIVKDKTKCDYVKDYTPGSRKMIDPAKTHEELNRVSV